MASEACAPVCAHVEIPYEYGTCISDVPYNGANTIYAPAATCDEGCLSFDTGMVPITCNCTIDAPDLSSAQFSFQVISPNDLPEDFIATDVLLVSEACVPVCAHVTGIGAGETCAPLRAQCTNVVIPVLALGAKVVLCTLATALVCPIKMAHKCLSLQVKDAEGYYYFNKISEDPGGQIGCISDVPSGLILIEERHVVSRSLQEFWRKLQKISLLDFSVRMDLLELWIDHYDIEIS